MVLYTDNAWNFRLTVDRSLSAVAAIRPYWRDGRGELTNDEIVSEIGPHDGQLCIAAIRQMGAAQ